MKYQKKPEERKNNLIPVCSNETCRQEHGPLPKSSFHYSIIENYPMHYEYGSNPVWTAFTVSSFSRLSVEIDITMRNPENYLRCAEKYSRSQTL